MVRVYRILILVLLLFIPIAYASDLMSFTANVKNSAGANINSGNIVVEIYDDASAGNLIYNSTSDFYNNISNGQVDVMLGSGTQQLNLGYGKDYYMEVYVNGADLDFRGKERQQFQAGIGNVSLGKMNVSSSFIPAVNSTFDLGNSVNGWWNNIFGFTGYFLSKVGIGTTNPTVALNVTGNVGVTGIVTANSFIGYGIGLTGVSSMNYANLALTNQSNVFTSNVTISNNLTVGGNRFYVDGSNNGYVGINTTTPSNVLHVNGAINVSSGNARVYIGKAYVYDNGHALVLGHD